MSLTQNGNAATRPMKILSPSNYEVNGETKTRWTQVGVAFPARDASGLNIEITPGLAVTGRLIIRPWETKHETNTPAPPDEPRSFIHDPELKRDGLV